MADAANMDPAKPRAPELRTSTKPTPPTSLLPTQGPDSEQTQFTHLRPLPPPLIARHAIPFPSRPPNRLLPMRILVLGLCRTGTSSLRLALQHLGLTDVYHMSNVDIAGREECDAWMAALRRGAEGKRLSPDEERIFWDRMTGHVEAVLDIPSSLCAEELLRVYPDAKIVLSVRSPGPGEGGKEKHLCGASSFASSVEATIFKMRDKVWWMREGVLADFFTKVVPVPRHMLVKRATVANMLGTVPDLEGEDAESMNARLSRVYEAHNEAVLELCRDLGRKVLVYDCRDGWDPLVDFLKEDGGLGSDLELDVPVGADGKRIPFPWINDKAAFLRLVSARMKSAMAKSAAARAKAFRVLGGVLGVGIAFGFWWRRR